MPRRSLLRHTVHLFNWIGEVDDKVQYQKVIIKNCYCPINDSVDSSNSLSKASDNVKLYIFKRGTSVQSEKRVKLQYIPYEKWNSLKDKKGYWTINPGMDYFVRSDRSERIKIIGFRDLEAGSQRMWHFEVTGK